MITLKYRKSGNAVFISHIDTLRGMVRAIRRAEINMAYSKGFNPHMLLFFSPPLALGVNSEAEYVTADCTGMTAEEFKAEMLSLNEELLKLNDEAHSLEQTIAKNLKELFK